MPGGATSSTSPTRSCTAARGSSSRPLGPNDVIVIDGRIYVPFAPFPAIVLAPLVALVGAVTADQLESGVNAFLAATVVFLAWWAAGRIGVERLRDRFGLVLLLGLGHAGPGG